MAAGQAVAVFGVPAKFSPIHLGAIKQMGKMRASCGTVSALIVIGLATQTSSAQIATSPPPPANPAGTTSATPTGNPGEWVTSDDYPTKALRENAAGTTAFRLAIGIDGTVTRCTVIMSSGFQQLDEATCRLVTLRARFSPARSVTGEPVPGQYSNRVRWTIPEGSPDDPWQIGPTANNLTFVVEADGAATNCRSTLNGVDTSTSSRDNPCLRGKKFVPFVDASGNAVRRRVTMTMTVTVTDPAVMPPPRKKRRR